MRKHNYSLLTIVIATLIVAVLIMLALRAFAPAKEKAEAAAAKRPPVEQVYQDIMATGHDEGEKK